MSNYSVTGGKMTTLHTLQDFAYDCARKWLLGGWLNCVADLALARCSGLLCRKRGRGQCSNSAWAKVSVLATSVLVNTHDLFWAVYMLMSLTMQVTPSYLTHDMNRQENMRCFNDHRPCGSDSDISAAVGKVMS